METCAFIKDQITCHLERYRKKHGKENLQKIADDINCLIDIGDATDLVLLDILKAFGSVNQQRLDSTLK